MPELPPPLPPAERTVGQLIAESIRAYGHRFWLALPLGLPLAIADQLNAGHGWGDQPLVYWALTPLFVAAYLWGCRLVLEAGATWTAAVLAALVWIPFPVLRAFFLLPGIAWLAFVGLSVPVAMVERSGFRESLIRGRRLAQADFVHAFGSLCALAIVAGIASQVLGALLHSQSDTGLRVALFVSDLVLSPLLYIGAALVFVDQSARVGSGGRAALHPPHDADPPGRADAQVEP
jgi:hypothetical protein